MCKRHRDVGAGKGTLLPGKVLYCRLRGEGERAECDERALLPEIRAQQFSSYQYHLRCTIYGWMRPTTELNIDSNYKNINQNTKEAIGDIDGDGLNDVIIAPAETFRNGGNTHLAWYKNPGNTSSTNWQRNILLALTNNTHTVKLGDLDNDGDLDVVTGIPWENSVSDISVNAHYNNGSGVFSAPQIIESGKGLYSGVVFDIDNDGDIDIVGQNIFARDSKPYVYENLLARSATPTPPRPPSEGQTTTAPIFLLLDDE